MAKTEVEEDASFSTNVYLSIILFNDRWGQVGGFTNDAQEQQVLFEVFVIIREDN